MAVIDALVEQRARDAVNVLASRANLRAAYLFGSQVEGTAREESDIDVAAFLDDLPEWGIEERVMLAIELRRAFGEDMEFHFYRGELAENPEPASFAQYILRHGVCIWRRPETVSFSRR